MNPIFYLRIAKDLGCGLCNQLYALTGCLDHTLGKRVSSWGQIIVLDSFLKEIQTPQKCSVTDVFDLPKMNSILQPLSILLVAKEEFTGVHITGVTLGETDITPRFLSTLVFDSLLFVPQSFDLRCLDKENKEDKERILQDTLKIHCLIAKKPWLLSFQTENGKLKEDLGFPLAFSSSVHHHRFQPSPQLYFGGTSNAQRFVFLLQNVIHFQSSFQTLSHNALRTFYVNETNKTTDSSLPLHLIHLRLENDALQSFQNQPAFIGCFTQQDLKQKMEKKYIHLIDKYIPKNEPVVVITSDTDNAVMTYLHQHYPVFTSFPKPYVFREFNAIHDLLFASCPGIPFSVFIGVYESSFSYSVMYHLFRSQPQTVKSIIFKINCLDAPERCFTNSTPLDEMQRG